ncbi:pyrroloquinoline quinone-dependent dehydrogenase [Proteobacteria bacterium 005FR1]|nr:pyrroloquinoline quinone-dependent dehydrogenase [Proteobacteria bacterium 005FR1]
MSKRLFPAACKRLLSASGLAIALAAPVSFANSPDAEWTHYGNDAGGSRYSPLEQINRNNVAQLKQAWVYRTGDLGEGFPSGHRMAFEATPLFVDGLLYLSTPYGQIHALDGESGAQVWQFDTNTAQDRHYSENTSRGVSLWRSGAEGFCERRILFATLDGRLLALDAGTGRLCESFGKKGIVDLNADVRRTDEKGGYVVTSPPAIRGDLVITGSAIGDNRGVELELGIVRAFDARSGQLVWSWDPIPRGPENPAYGEWAPESAAITGAANAWAPLSVDEARGLVFIPTGSASPDFSGHRRPGSNRHANSVVALKAETGELLWARQLVHHDLWDFDVPAQPVLSEVERDGESIPVVIQATKMGMLYVLHRESGEAIFPIEERPVPASRTAGEEAWPTQPFSSIALVPQHPLRAEHAWGLTFIDRMHCERQIEKYVSEGIFTPPSEQGSILFPGYAGGSNWGSVAVDEQRQIVVANTSQIPFLVQLIPSDKVQEVRDSGDYPDSEFARQRGTPYGMRRELLTSFAGIPCTAPPWGSLHGIDLKTGKIAWTVPLGTTEDIAPWPFKNIQGVPNLGGPLVTASGLVFIGAAADDYLRVFDVNSGEELLKLRLPAGGQATPMTYRHQGKQYVVIAAGGHGGMGTTRGDFLVAFALPGSE